MAIGSESFAIYLTRHAEKAGSQDDPDLTHCGEQRARYLAQWLQQQQPQVVTIYSTAYRRTQATATPSAELLQLVVQGYDPRQLASFAEQLRASGESALIVGHSNTTPQLAQLLSGTSTSAIEHDEFDRLYKVEFAGEQIEMQQLKLDFDCKTTDR
ncbi:hypothetical protein GCM10011369_12560 [Neiella marina]|uniref:Histidine phosphatase family protein n=1 Tax=Neiella marina TaxID=508461 RepID=A0A8J2U3V2_9GAMM|nr:hypothetical protein GCM10011369_12560 [Neiella marina]